MRWATEVRNLHFYSASIDFFPLKLTMNPPVWSELLSENRYVTVGQYSSIQGIHSLPRVCRGMACLPTVLHRYPIDNEMLKVIWDQ